MTRARPRLTLAVSNEQRLVLRTKRSGRLGFGVAAVGLTVAMLLAAQPGDFREPGTYFYLLLVAVCGGAALWVRTLELNQETGLLTSRSGPGPLILSARSLALNSVVAVRVTESTALGPATSGRELPRWANSIANRSRVVRLRLETTQATLALEEAGDREELESLGKAVATFLGVPLKVEER